MQKTLTNAEIENLYVALVQLINSGTILPKRMAFRANLNVNTLKPIVEAINDIRNDNKEINKFNLFRKEYMETNCLKNEDGSFFTNNNNYVFENTTKVLEEFNKLLKTEFPNIETILTQHLKECNDMLNEKSDVNLQIITEEDLPESLPGNLVTAILPMIKTDNGN